MSVDRFRIPPRLQHELKTERTSGPQRLVAWALWLLGLAILIGIGVLFLAIVDRPGIGRAL